MLHKISVLGGFLGTSLAIGFVYHQMQDQDDEATLTEETEMSEEAHHDHGKHLSQPQLQRNPQSLPSQHLANSPQEMTEAKESSSEEQLKFTQTQAEHSEENIEENEEEDHTVEIQENTDDEAEEGVLSENEKSSMDDSPMGRIFKPASGNGLGYLAGIGSSGGGVSSAVTSGSSGSSESETTSSEDPMPDLPDIF